MVEKHVYKVYTTYLWFYCCILLFYPHWRWGYTLLFLEVSRNKAIAAILRLIYSKLVIWGYV